MKTSVFVPKVQMASKSILLLAGEASGDYHAAAMVKDLKASRPDIRVSGIGGDKLAEAGMELLHHYREINTIGLSEGLSKIANILTAYRTMKRELQSGRHDIFIPVDFPDVNLRLCRVARDSGVGVCYYISPQVWAWRKGRVRKIASRVDRMMTIFPFEPKVYEGAGLRADFVGHTMVRDISPALDKALLRERMGLAPDASAVSLVPGSRPAEIRRMLPVMCEAARLYADQYPDTQFLLPLAGVHLSGIVEEIVRGCGVQVRVCSTETAELMAACDSGLVTSGTATLQAALAGMPHAVAYKLDRFTWLLAIKVLKPLVMDKDLHVAIGNVLAISREKETFGPLQEVLNAGYRIPCLECGRPLFVPELLQHNASPENLAQWLIRFRSEPLLREAMIRGFQRVREMLTPERDDITPASVVLEFLDQRKAGAQ
jgi:lipid-A-disaccharide synthase